MFDRLKMRLGDIKTITRLIEGADRQAHQAGEEVAGAEHFLLSALTLPDGTAQQVFARVGVDPDQLPSAIAAQYQAALKAVGIDIEVQPSPAPVAGAEDGPPPAHRSSPSGQAVMKALYALKQTDKQRPLLGAHVVAVIAAMPHSIPMRAMQMLGIDPHALAAAATKELAASC